MVGLFDIYKEHLRVEIALKLQYPFDALMGMLQMAVEPVIYLMVWRAVAGQGDELGGYTESSLAAYYIIFLFLRHFVLVQSMWVYEWRIRTGEMSILLLRPLHPIHTDLAEVISYKLFASMVLAPILVVMAIVFEAEFTAAWWMWLLFVPAAVLGAAVRFIFQYAFSLLGFWTTRINAIEQMYGIAQTFFGGALAPLALLPAPLLTIASVLPFRWILAFPIELAMGRLAIEEIIGGFLAQILWLVGVTPIMLVVWRSAVKHYGAVGG
jgi:ABC-2 type transport system permease protein